jgi:hypothetical protein
LFGPPEENNFNMLESRVEDIPQVSEVENTILTAHFCEMEIKDAIFSMKCNQALGPNGFFAEFCRVFLRNHKG